MAGPHSKDDRRDNAKDHRTGDHENAPKDDATRDAALPSWTKPGLRFQCTECGKCCSGKNGYIWITEKEIQGLAAHLGLTLNEFGSRYLRRIGNRYSLLERPHSGECVFLIGEHCGVYEHRPSQCRSYPFWPRILESPTAWKNEAQECEGVRDDAPLVSQDEIKQITKA